MLQEANDILEQPIETPVVSVSRLVPKVQGVTYRDQWKAHPDIDVKALARAVADGVVPATFLTPNLTAINQFARATQGTQPVAGVRWFNDRQIAARG
jgi:acylphosphatase